MRQPSSPTAIRRFLSSLPLFEEVSSASLDELARVSIIRAAPKGTFLFFQDDPVQGVYLVRRGAVAIRLENPDGRELVINEMGPGDCFGELGILTGQPRSTGAEAIVDSEVLFIPNQAFEAILTKEPALALRLLEITAQRLINSSKREEALAFHDAQQRLASLLLQLDAQSNEKGFLSLSQEELAQRAGLTRQTVATILGGWRRRGWLLTGRGNIVLLNRSELDSIGQNQEIAQRE
jgi:CRP/FNR family transcriptional regulator, cyclic AMP receptor protein